MNRARWKVKPDPEVKPYGSWSIQQYGTAVKFAVSGPLMAEQVIQGLAERGNHVASLLVHLPAPELECGHPERFVEVQVLEENTTFGPEFTARQYCRQCAFVVEQFVEWKCGCDVDGICVRCHICGEMVNVACWQCHTPRGGGRCPHPVPA